MSDLQSELDGLASRIASFKDPAPVSDADWQKFADKTVVALMAGGESSRYAAALEGQAVNKNAHELPNGDTMIEMTIRTYRDAGLKNFVALVFHNAHSIEDRLGDGSKMGVKITYSHDPERPVGRGGAVRNALENGSIPEDSYLITLNPDDVVMGFPESLPRYIGSAFLEDEANGLLATVGLVPGQEYAGTGMMVVDGDVVDTQMYPLIPLPFHAGITVFSPKIFPRFKKLFSLTEKSDFENVLFPALVKEKQLGAVGITKGTFIAVNDLKSYKLLVSMLDGKNG